MNDDDFSMLTVPQLVSHCGPCSLSYCLYLLGIEATQREIAWSAGMPIKTFVKGMDPDEIMRAAANYGVAGEEVLFASRGSGSRFIARLKRHLKHGHPALLLVADFEHWVAVLGVTEDGQVVIADPDDEDRAFSKYSDQRVLTEGWNDDGEDDPDNPPQYYALLLKRKDGKPSRWKITGEWMKLVQRGSEENLQELAEDVAEVAMRAGGNTAGKGQIYLADVMREYEKMVPEEVAHWVEVDVSLADLRGLYRDFRVAANALRLQVPRNVNHGRIVAQLTVLLSTWAWVDEL